MSLSLYEPTFHVRAFYKHPQRVLGQGKSKKEQDVSTQEKKNPHPQDGLLEPMSNRDGSRVSHLRDWEGLWDSSCSAGLGHRRTPQAVNTPVSRGSRGGY